MTLKFCSDGEYNVEMDDLELLYRTYVKDSLSSGRMEEDKLAALNQLRNILGLGKREAESITADITSKVYREQLAQFITAGELETSESKAVFLQNLCEQLHFDAQKASEIHADSIMEFVYDIFCDPGMFNVHED
ncbi:hypothetical protein POM88_040583 [Heracleum sosnowskyi]|uniref:Uncharacterized protein n=1 Tax=Heracleum sosnowskyi TaxID=360622 RepID=A0AAD8HF76_9APIA|nr:hypothetical protein POM88_040583 [Heracleum sosnowskyi]